MANAAIPPAYALNLTVVLDKFFNTPQGVGFDIAIVLSSQMVGFAFAGICRRFLVWPSAMIWPQNLVLCTLLNTFHAEDDDGQDGSMTRFRFFCACGRCADSADRRSLVLRRGLLLLLPVRAPRGAV